MSDPKPSGSRVAVLQHAPHEGPARLALAFERDGFELDVLRLDLGVPVPRSLEGMRALVVLGGSMGVADVGDAKYPFLADEVPLLQKAVAAGFPTLGVCLGAQLLAHAAGAHVYPNELGDPPFVLREVGWGAVHFVRSPADEPVLEGLDPAEMVVHWHGDTFDLPPGATLLASTLQCENQMFRLGKRLFGVQFHPELDAADIATWVEEDAAYVRAALGPTGAARIAADTARYLERQKPHGDRLLDNLVRALVG